MRPNSSDSEPVTSRPENASEPASAAVEYALMDALDSHVIVAVTDARGIITYVNKQFCRISEYSKEELIGQNHRIINSGYHSASFWKQLWDTIRSGQVWKGQIRNRAKSGRLYWVQTTIHPVLNEDGSVKQFVAFRDEITAQKEAESDLRQSQMHLQEASRLAKVGAWEFDLLAQKLHWSWTTKLIHEVPPDYEPDLESGISFYPEGEMRDRITALVQRGIETGEPWDEQLQILSASLRLKWVRAIGRAEMLDGRCVRLYGVFQDIDEEVRQRQRSERNAALIGRIIDGATEFGVIATDVQGVITVFNAGAERMLGYQASEMVGNQTPAIIHLPEEVEQRAAELTERFGYPVSGFDTFAKVAALEGSERREWTYVKKSGERIPVSLVVTPLRGSSGEINGYLGISQDLSAQKRAEGEAQESEARFRKAFEHSAIGIAMVSLEGRWIKVNPALQRMLGYDEQTLLSMSFQDVTHPEDLDADLALVQETIAGKRLSYTMEKRYINSHGEILWARLDVSMVRGPDRQPLYFVSQVIDITEAKTFTRRMKKFADRLALATRAGGVGIWDFDLKSGSLIWDDQMFVLYGVDQKDFTASVEDWTQALHPDDRAAAVAKIEGAIAGTGDFDTEFRIIRRSDGSERHLRGLATVERDETGKAVRMVGTNWDVTDQFLQKQTLRIMAEQAEQANRSKSQFLANMSHEIRTPINGVIGMTGLLLDSEGLSAEQRKQAELIRSSGEALLTVINDILDFSKIEAGKLDLEIVDFPLRDSLREVRALLEQRAAEKQLSLSYSVDEVVPDQLRGDPGRLRQILLNLAGNAIKFTERGEVSMHVQLESRHAKAAVLRFMVRDTGIGIKEEKLRGLFDEFTQADTSTTRLYGGTGLGLAICKQLSRLMNGEIGVSSEWGKGSEFWFTAEFAIGDGLSGVTNSAARGTALWEGKINPKRFEGLKCRVLVAEDNSVNQMVVSGVLAKFGLRADIVANGHEALEALRRVNYELVLMDVQMPEMDGLDASCRIRAGEAGDNAKGVPIVALTAHARAEDRRDCMAAGMTDYTSKPIMPEALFQILDRLLPKAPGDEGEQLDGASVEAEERSVFDRDKFLDGMMGDQGLAQEIATLSLQDLEKHRDGLDELFASGTADSLLRAVHSIKGVSGHTACLRLNDKASELEKEMLSGGEELVRGSYQTFVALLDEGMDALRGYLKE